ncbi:nitroreductase family protein [Nannocystis pusilla]|uniref:nitroreductase family protein n=1 Tax=Nannocystis pusilla TaxID=889268 RepID=UPI003B789C60
MDPRRAGSSVARAGLRDGLRERPLDARVRRDSCVGFVLSLCLAAHARGLGTCIQYGYLAFEDELKETLGIDPQQSLVAVVLLGWPDPESPVNAAAIEGARRRPVPVAWR